jgi:hypothetical protein
MFQSVAIPVLLVSVMVASSFVAVRLAAQQDFYTALLTLLDPEHILSFLVVLVVWGAGRWFSRSGWPWIQAHLDRRQELEHKLRLEEMVLDREAQVRLEELNRQMLDAFGSFREEVGGFRAVQEQVAAILLSRGALNWLQEMRGDED